jgi:hypothetical protein
MTAYVERINYGKQHPTKFLGMGISGPLYSLMPAERSEPASSAKILRKATAQIPTTKACSSFKTLSTTGVGIHWGNSSCFKWST